MEAKETTPIETWKKNKQNRSNANNAKQKTETWTQTKTEARKTMKTTNAWKLKAKLKRGSKPNTKQGKQ